MISGRIALAKPFSPEMPGREEVGRDIERRGRFDTDMDLEVEGGGEEVTGPAIDATICASWM